MGGKRVERMQRTRSAPDAHILVDVLCSMDFFAGIDEYVSARW